jgi:hypothetical protein
MMSSGFKSEYLSNAVLPPNGYASSLPSPTALVNKHISHKRDSARPVRSCGCCGRRRDETVFNLAVGVSVDGRSACYFVVQIAALNRDYSHPLSDGGAIAAVL